MPSSSLHNHFIIFQVFRFVYLTTGHLETITYGEPRPLLQFKIMAHGLYAYEESLSLFWTNAGLSYLLCMAMKRKEEARDVASKLNLIPT